MLAGDKFIWPAVWPYPFDFQEYKEPARLQAGDKLATDRLFDNTYLIFKSSSSQPAAGWWQVVKGPAVWQYLVNFQEYKQPASCRLVTSCQTVGCVTISILFSRVGAASQLQASDKLSTCSCVTVFECCYGKVQLARQLHKKVTTCHFCQFFVTCWQGTSFLTYCIFIFVYRPFRSFFFLWNFV